MPWITSANIACGGHAGDDATMRETVRLAVAAGVALGAHPGFEDRENFGRLEQNLSTNEVRALVRRQVERLRAIAEEQGAALVHVKPHGALYNLAARSAPVAEAIAAAVREIDAALRLVGLAGSEVVKAGERVGLAVMQEGFADRRYEADGSLTPRTHPAALITDEAEAVAQAQRLVREGRVLSRDGVEVRLKIDTICLHGDGEHAVAFARRLRQAVAC